VSGQQLRDELVARVTALDGKQAIIDNNQESLSATVEALAECTSIDKTTILSIAEQVSVKHELVNASNEPVVSATQDRNTRIAKRCAILVCGLFAFSIAKWLSVNGTLKTVLHEVSPVQSRAADFYMRTGRYPYSFENLNFTNGPPPIESVSELEIGPNGELLVSTSGLFSSQVLLTPKPLVDGRTKWICSTNSSWLFKISSWSCTYKSSISFKQI